MEYQFVIIFISILFSAFFSGMKMAFMSANKFQIELDKKQRGFIDKILQKITSKSAKFTTTMLVGNKITLVIYSFFMSNVLLNLLPINSSYSTLSILLIHAAISSLILLITAEFLPKAIFGSYSNKMLYFFAPLAYIFWLLFNLFSEALIIISNFILKVFFNTNKSVEQSKFSKAELENYITEQLENASDTEEVDAEIQIFQNALEFNNVKSREIMTPRTEIIAVDITETLPNLIQLFVKTGYSKIVVYKNDLDNVLGYAHSFEVFKRPKNLHSILLPIEFIPESMPIHNVLNLLSVKKKSMAIVLDEFGGTSGVMTVEDIVEEIFGEIVDEHDTVELLEQKIAENTYNLSARLEVDYLNEKYHLNLEENEAYETLGGYIVFHNEDIPKEGEVLEINNIQYKMIKVDSAKIKEVYVKILDTD